MRELSKKKIDVPDEKISRSTAIPTTTTCVSYCLLFNTGILISRKKKNFFLVKLLRFGFCCLSTVSCLFTFHTWLFLKHKKYCKTLLLFANVHWYLVELGHHNEAFANRFVVDAMVGTFGISLWISSLEDSKSRIGQARGYRSQGVCQVSVF